MLQDDHDWLMRYRPATPTPWLGRGGGRFHEHVVCDDLRQPLECAHFSHTFGLIGFACEEGVKRNKGRLGAAKGPEAFRKKLANLPYFLKDCTIYDVGDITCDDGNLELAQEALGKSVQFMLAQGIIPIVIGGGHEVAYGHYLGLPKEDLSIVNFDAHFDLREGEPSSGTPFLQIAKEQTSNFDYTVLGIQRLGNTEELFERADKLRVNYVFAEDRDLLVRQVEAITKRKTPIYLTICLDVFAAAFAPGVSAPQALGLAPLDILEPLQKLISTGRVISMNIAELSPPLDQGGQTASLAANLISHMLHAY